MASFIKSISRFTFEEDRLEEARYWSAKTIEERVIASWDLAEDNLIAVDKIHESTQSTAVTFCRVKH